MLHRGRGAFVLVLTLGLAGALQAQAVDGAWFADSRFPTYQFVSDAQRGDFDGDGLTDLLLGGQFETTLSLVLGDGRDGFGAPTLVEPGVPLQVVRTGDLDADGRLDAVVLAANGVLQAVALLGDGAGHLAVGPITELDPGAGQLAIGDLDGDGLPDLVVTHLEPGFVYSAQSLLGDGAGHFAKLPAVPGLNNSETLALGDLDADGNLDLVAARQGITSGLRLLGDGAGSFGPVLAIGSLTPIGGYPALNLADMNGDGRLDVVVGSMVHRKTEILLGDGAGGIVSNIVLNQLATHDVGDIDGDEVLDFAGIDDHGDVTLALGTGDGHLVKPWILDLGQFANPLLADLDGDAHAELLGFGGPGQVSVVPGRVLQSKQVAAAALSSSTSMSGLAVGDVNGDGYPELVAPTPLGFGHLEIHINDKQGGFKTSVSLDTNANFEVALLDDTDDDGELDALMLGTGDFNLHVMKGQPGVNFAPKQSFSMFSPEPVCLAAGDLDGDGRNEVLAGRLGAAASVGVMKGLAAGQFTLSANYATAGDDVRSVALGDLDEDGHLDVVAANRNSASLAVLLGDGLGALLPATAWTAGVGAKPMSVALADLDEDGHLDVASANFDSDNVSLLHGDGQGALSDGVSVPVGDKPYAVATPDLNGDGHVDLATLSQSDSQVTLCYGDGDGNFPRVGLVGMESVEPVVFGQEDRVAFRVSDLDLDGRPDFAALGKSQSSAAIHVRLNVGPAPWADLGGPLAGGAGTPRLFGEGSLEESSAGALRVNPVAPAATALFFVSLDRSAVPFKGGVLQALPAVLLLTLGTGAGEIELPFTWPAGLPAGLQFVTQCAIQDAGAPHGVALSNALLGLTP